MIPEKIQNPVCSLDELRTIQILDGIDDRRLEALRKHLCLVEHEQGDVILHQGEVSEALYFLLSGQVAAILKEENGKQHSLAELTPGDTFGEHALLTGGSTRIFSSLNSAPCTFSPLCFDRRNSFFLASAKLPEPTVLSQPDWQNWSSGYDVANLCWVFGGDVERTALGGKWLSDVALFSSCVDL